MGQEIVLVREVANLLITKHQEHTTLPTIYPPQQPNLIALLMIPVLLILLYVNLTPTFYTHFKQVAASTLDYPTAAS